MYHIRWFTIPDQEHLPIQEKRFCDLPPEETWASFFYNLLFIPVVFYFIWSVNYSLLQFKLAADRIKRKKRDNMYQLFQNLDLVKKVVAIYKLNGVSPLMFLTVHFIMFIVTHLLAIIQYQYFWFSTLVVGFYTILSIWNGACFYMEYFCKKYEKQLEELEQMHLETV